MDPEIERKRVLSRAYNLLAVRARSSDEMRRRLCGAGFTESAVDDALAQLQRQSLLDDRSFALSWVRSRMQSRPRGTRLLERELREKGISGEDVAAAIADIDDDATALKLATHRADILKGLDRKTFVRRLSNYLLARGFSGQTVSRAVTSVLPGPDDS
jgi:regulatory protein